MLLSLIISKLVVYLTSSCVNWAFSLMLKKTHSRLFWRMKSGTEPYKCIWQRRKSLSAGGTAKLYLTSTNCCRLHCKMCEKDQAKKKQAPRSTKKQIEIITATSIIWRFSTINNQTRTKNYFRKILFVLFYSLLINNFFKSKWY
jgi:hypothetical protein